MSKVHVIHGIRFKNKSDSWLMKLFAFLLKPFVPQFMTGVWTTIGTTIYVPEGSGLGTLDDEVFFNKRKSILVHEGKHISDFKKFHILFILSYLFPPLFLAYGRYVWERRAYLAELETYSDDLTDEQLDRQIDGIATLISGKAYLWAWPKKWIVKWFYNYFYENNLTEIGSDDVK